MNLNVLIFLENEKYLKIIELILINISSGCLKFFFQESLEIFETAYVMGTKKI